MPLAPGSLCYTCLGKGACRHTLQHLHGILGELAHEWCASLMVVGMMTDKTAHQQRGMHK